MRNILISLLCVLLALLIALGCILGVYLINYDDVSIYQLRIAEGNRYIENEDYDQAIAEYRAAISEVPDNEEAYYQLALLYIKLDRMDDAMDVLSLGLERAFSSRLQDLYERYFNSDKGFSDLENEDTDTGVINSQLCKIIANYTYDDYRIDFSGFREKSIGIYYVSDTAFNGELHFFDVEGESISIDSNGNPLAEVRPNYIVLDDLSLLFSDLVSDKRISYSDLKNYGVYDITTGHDSRGNYVRFNYDHCITEIVLDSDDCFGRYSSHILYSEYGVGEAALDIKHKGSIKVISATTAEAVAQASVLVKDDGGSQVDQLKTDSSGNCYMELSEGSYVMTVTAEGYIEENFEFRVYSSGEYSIDRVSISPELESGQIRVVLEWGKTPSDLDSYYFDDKNGMVRYDQRQYYDDGELIAELDVDDSDGYGPETLTVYDTERYFKYAVADFTGSNTLFSRTDVTVKVYLPGESQPVVFSPPGDSGIRENAWIVFEYEDGEIKYIGEPAPTRGVNGK